MKRFFLLFLLFPAFLFAQKHTISGTISDASSGEKLIGVTLRIQNQSVGVTTNEYGFYSLTLPKGNYKIIVEYLGYETIYQDVTLVHNLHQDFKLSVQEITLSGVEVSANLSQKSDVQKPQMGVASIAIPTIKKLPVLMGEVDIVKTMLQLPGVSNAGEASSGFNVRGGGADQNLILLDEAIVFNASHLFGFLSVFNADAVRDFKLYKGTMPAQFGGRTSSVLDIYQKEGNKNHFAMKGGIGALSSRLLMEAPTVKDKGSFLIGARASYAHLFLKLAKNDNVAYFYDVNMKLSHQINANNNLYLSGYFGRDTFRLNDFLGNTYGNSFVNLRWNHLFSDNLFSNLSLIYSDYYYGFSLTPVKFQWDSGIKNFNLKYDFKHYLSEKLKLSYGLQGVYYDFNPGKIFPTAPTSSVREKILARKYALETGIYADVEQKLLPNFNISYGLRLSSFYHLGKREMNLYSPEGQVVFNTATQTYEKGTPIGTKYFGSGKIINLYSHLEPRLSVAYSLNENTSFKASYTRTTQYLHLLSNTSSPTPLDVWTPSDTFLKPQIADQYSVGYVANFASDKFSFEAEAYYKNGKNRVDYIDGADLIANDAIEQVVLQGKTRAYGLELLLRKNAGRLTGWIAYTLSKSEQQTPARNENETGINFGKWYNTAYDKPHDISVTATYLLSKKWTLGGIFTLKTGLPTNLPQGKYNYFGLSIPQYGARNESRLPVYHRLDISATYTPDTKEGQRYKSEWVFGVYNLYNRKNATSIFFRENKDTQRNEAVKLSIFGIVPSVTYNFSF